MHKRSLSLSCVAQMDLSRLATILTPQGVEHIDNAIRNITFILEDDLCLKELIQLSYHLGNIQTVLQVHGDHPDVLNYVRHKMMHNFALCRLIVDEWVSKPPVHILDEQFGFLCRRAIHILQDPAMPPLYPDRLNAACFM